MLHYLRVLCAILLASAVTACGSGATSGTIPLTTLGAPERVPSAKKKLKATIRITIPKRKHHHRVLIHGHYVSPSTQSIAIAIAPSAGGATTSYNADLTPASNPNCTASLVSPLICTITLDLAAGSYTASFATYDGLLSGGNVPNNPPTGNELSANQHVPLTVVVGANNQINVTLDGIPTSALFVPLDNTMSGNAASGYTMSRCYGSARVEVLGLDADDNAILGPGAPAPALLSGDTTHLGIVATPSPSSPNTFTLSPSAPLTTNLPTANGVVQLTASVTPAAASGGSTRSATVKVTFSGGVCDVVTLATDTNATANGQPPGTGVGSAGDLRYTMLHASAGDTILFDPTTMCGGPSCTITLGGPLPPIVKNLTIDGGIFGNVVIDGSSKSNASYRVFFVDSGTVTLANLQIQNALAKGGNGGGVYGDAAGGGGGAGLGAGLFVNQASAAVNVTRVYFLNCGVAGGGGAGVDINQVIGQSTGGGGGGLGGAGGINGGGGGGGGGVLGGGWGGNSGQGTNNGPNGGLGGGGGGGGATGGIGGAGGAAYAGNTAGQAGGTLVSQFFPANGGNGGFGGGGGGENGGNGGGNGGFGGGGGGNNGAGGAGGGGAGGGTGGALASVSGGNGGTGGDASGGGGAAAGPAIFVNAGSLTTTESGASESSATGGAAGGADAAAGTADSTPVFNFAGTVNGSTATGPIASALSGNMPPAVRHRPQQKARRDATHPS